MSKCKKCGGSGLTSFEHVEHRGKPGGCFRCSGTGIEPPRAPRRTPEQKAADRKAMTLAAIEAGRDRYRREGKLQQECA